MSTDSTLVTGRHFDYITRRTQPEDPFLSKLRADAKAAGIPPISIGPAQASFMQILLRSARAKDVVEVGTLGGYSAISMARALPDGGLVRTIEIDEARARFAADQFARSGVGQRIRLLLGDARKVLPGIESGSADAIFLDADKAGYPAYLEEGLRILRPRGLVMVDNAFAFGQLFDEKPTDRETPAVRAFNEIMAQEKRVQSIIVPLGDGMWVGVRTD